MVEKLEMSHLKSLLEEFVENGGLSVGFVKEFVEF
jgi:hypothetical protein